MVEADEVIEKIVSISKEAFRLFWEFLESLPLKPQETLGIAAGVIALIILISCCICCRFCKKPEEKKEVAGKFDLRKTHLFGPHYAERVTARFDEIDYNIEATQFDALSEIKLGQIRFSIFFDNEENIVEVTVHECKDLPPEPENDEVPDPYVRVMVEGGAKKTYNTKTKKNNTNPKYEQTFYFKKVTYGAFTNSTLRLKVYHDDFGGDDLLGEANVPICDLDMSKGKVTQWRVLAPEFKDEGMFVKDTKLGYLCVGLGYAPNSCVLAIFIMSCRKLLSVDEGGFSDPYVTLFLISDGKKLKKRKTTVKLRTLNPSFNEIFAFEASFEALDELSLQFIVADYDKGQPGEPIGQCMIGQLGSSERSHIHWKSMRKGPNKPWLFWHMLRPVPPVD